MAFYSALKIARPIKIFQYAHRYVHTISSVQFQHQMPIFVESRARPQVYYGGRHTVTLLPGAGIGPELMGYVKEIFNFTNVPVDFEEIEINPNSKNVDSDFNYVLMSIRRNGVALKGNIEFPGGEATAQGNVMLRKDLDLYVNAVRARSYPGVACRYNNLDVVVIRQNTEGEYAMLEHQTVAGVVESMKILSKDNAERIIRYAFEYAMRHGRKKVTTVHKANIMKLSDGLFLNTSREISRDYPDIMHNDMIIDNACMQLVANPYQFDMILTTNLYGSIISNVLCGLLGGAGLVSGTNVGEQYVIFEPATRSTGSNIAGKGIANPIAMISASADMLRYLGRKRHANIIWAGIVGSIGEGVLTRDLGGQASTREVVDSILRHIEIAMSNE